MDIKQLRTFHLVAELGSLRKASDLLGTVESALSRQIHMLEKHLNAPLFVRNGRGMILTPEGIRLRERAGDLLGQIDKLKDDIRTGDEIIGGDVMLGMTSAMSYTLGGQIAEAVARSQPSIALRFVETSNNVLLERLLRREIDLAVMIRTEATFNLPTEDLASEEYKVIGRPELLPAGTTVTMKWLLDQPLILSTYISSLLSLEAKKLNLHLKAAAEPGAFHIAADLVMRGLGITVMPPTAFRREINAQSIAVRTLKRPRLKRQLILTHREEKRSPAANAVAAIIRTEIAKLFGASQ